MKKTALLLTACSVLALALAGCGDKKADQAPAAAKEVTITVGATPVPHADILKVAAPELKKQGVNLKVIEFTDYVKPQTQFVRPLQRAHRTDGRLLQDD